MPRKNSNTGENTVRILGKAEKIFVKSGQTLRSLDCIISPESWILGTICMFTVSENDCPLQALFQETLKNFLVKSEGAKK